jgi:hypothetical protein
MPRLLALACALLLAACAADPLTGPLTLQSQGSFFIGGRAVHSDTLSTLPAYAPSGTVAVDQMYVRHLTPPNASPLSVTLVHGCCLTGKTWETTPDGRMGWDEYFARRGFATYVVDQTWRGRSAGDIQAVNAVRLGRAPVTALPTVFAAGREAAWAIFRFGDQYPQTHPGLRFPLAAQEEFWKQMVPDWLNAQPTPNPTVPALGELSRRLGRNVLISHSQSGIYPFQAVAQNPAGIAAVIAVEPGACPDAAADVTPYLRTPMLVVWGDYVPGAPRWAPRLVNCRAFVAKVVAAGGKAEQLVLPERGIHGNSHMLMQDDNSLEIAGMLVDWVVSAVQPPR